MVNYLAGDDGAEVGARGVPGLYGDPMEGGS